MQTHLPPMPTLELPPAPSHRPSGRSTVQVSLTRQVPVIRCLACGRTEPRPADALRRLAEGRWTECCGRVMIPGIAPESVRELDETPWAERRLVDRRPPRPGARVELRRGGLGLGTDLAAELIDVSCGGVKLVLRGAVCRGDTVQVSLAPPKRTWEYRGTAEVCWCVTGLDDRFQAGIQFRRPLTDRDVAEITC
jgi:PilZ domain